MTGPEYTERFTYRVSDGVRTATGAVTVLVVDYIAQDDSGTTRAGEPVTIAVGANDIGFASPATAAIYSPASHGSLVVNGSPGPPGTISITYQPEPGFDGYDSFRYEMNDGTHNWIANVYVSVILDTDGDGVEDAWDNCTLVPNPDQFDVDYDGYGNLCDADLNNNNVTNAQDYAIFRSRLGNSATPPPYDIADLNGNGIVNAQDYAIFRTLLGAAPGPSGLHP